MSSIYVLPPAPRIAIDAACNAHASLVVFFVLSGYVLTGSLLRSGLSRSSVEGFYIGRLFRLLPALWVVSAIAAFFVFLFPPLLIHPPPSFWFVLFLHPFPSGVQILRAALAIDTSLIMPVWSIFIELMGSAIMPFLVTLALMQARLFNWILLGAGVAAFSLAQAPHRLDSLPYMFDFMLGTWWASRKWTFPFGRSLAKLFAAAFVLIFFRCLWYQSATATLPHSTLDTMDPLPMLVEGVAAFFLVGILASEHGAIRLLRSGSAISLGNVSYSLYLVHFPIAIMSPRF